MPTLSWINDTQARQEASKVPFHLLEKVKSYGDPNSENILVQGDNLLALKALLPFYRGKVKCIYIDLPYNTGNAFEHYDDNLEHSQWLSLLFPRLYLLRDFLDQHGTIWIQIDDDEQAYLKVICDEIFGRQNFINMVSVNMKNIAGASGGGEDKKLKKNCEYILVYAKNINSFIPFKPVYQYKPIYSLVEQYELEGKSWKYTNVLLSEGKKQYIGSTFDGSGDEIKIYKRVNYVIKSINEISESEGISLEKAYTKYGVKIFQTTNAQSSIRQRVIDFIEENKFDNDLLSIEYIPKSGRNKNKIYEQFYKGNKCRLFAWLKDTAEEKDGILYKKDRLGTYWDMNPWMKNVAKEGGVSFNRSKKPEKLIEIILQMATDENDWVMDSFLGSGTTTAVAMKLSRRFIGVEIGEHARTLCVPRLKTVIQETSLKKIKSGFCFKTLGECVFDEMGAINPKVDFKTLAAYIWQKETNTPSECKFSPLLGEHQGKSIFLLYNGVLGDKRPRAGNVLNKTVLKQLLKKYPTDNEKIVYGDACFGISNEELRAHKIIFKQIPYDLGM